VIGSAELLQAVADVNIRAEEWGDQQGLEALTSAGVRGEDAVAVGHLRATEAVKEVVAERLAARLSGEPARALRPDEMLSLLCALWVEGVLVGRHLEQT
jgi:hypothetical protein